MQQSPIGFSIRPDWLAGHDEPDIRPEQVVIDSHHHLYQRPDVRYLLDDYLADLSSGHNVRASVFVQARAMLRTDGDPAMRAVGETEFANGVAAMSASGIYGRTHVCAGIVGFADLTLGDAVRPVLERQITAGGGLTTSGGRFCGIRQVLCWDRDASLLNPAYPTTENMVETPAFRAGFAHLAELGLSFEVWAFFTQLPIIARLARTFPQTRIVINHCGGVLRVQGYESRTDMSNAWRNGIAELARCENVLMKLSGLGMRLSGFGLEDGVTAPVSAQLATHWRPWVLHCLESFGAARCMWGSNFPVDKGSYAYKVGLNAHKLLTASASKDEQDDIFWRTAQRHYGLPLLSD